MYPPTLPIQPSDAQAVLAMAPGQPTQPVEMMAAKSNTPIVVNSIIALLILGLFGMIIYKKRQTTLLRQRILLLERLWLLESRSPFEEQK
jgi:hypothetical protein